VTCVTCVWRGQVLSSVLGQTLIAGTFQALAAWWTFQVLHFHCDDTCPAQVVWQPEVVWQPQVEVEDSGSGSVWASSHELPQSLALHSPAPVAGGRLGVGGGGWMVEEWYGVLGGGVTSWLTLGAKGLARRHAPLVAPPLAPSALWAQTGEERGRGGPEEGEVHSCDGTEGYDIAKCCFNLPLGCTTRPIVPDTDDNILSFEATTAFLFSQFQYLSVVIAFNRSKPYRRSLVTNFWFFSWCVPFGAWFWLPCMRCVAVPRRGLLRLASAPSNMPLLPSSCTHTHTRTQTHTHTHTHTHACMHAWLG